MELIRNSIPEKSSSIYQVYQVCLGNYQFCGGIDHGAIVDDCGISNVGEDLMKWIRKLT